MTSEPWAGRVDGTTVQRSDANENLRRNSEVTTRKTSTGLSKTSIREHVVENS